MRSPISRRRKAWAVTALVAGSALGAGVPVLALSSSHDSAEAAVATITLQVNNIPGVTGPVSVTFAKFGGITYDVTVPQPTSSNSKAIANPVPPTITLSEPLAANVVTYRDMLAWERAIRAGLVTGREDATLTLSSGTGVTIAQYVLLNGFPTNVDVAAGVPQSTSFTVVLSGDDLVLASSTG